MDVRPAVHGRLGIGDGMDVTTSRQLPAPWGKRRVIWTSSSLLATTSMVRPPHDSTTVAGALHTALHPHLAFGTRTFALIH